VPETVGQDAAGNPYAALAVEHGLAVHRASLAWAERAITRLAADSPGRKAVAA
jgi:hypothetical protein